MNLKNRIMARSFLLVMKKVMDISLEPRCVIKMPCPHLPWFAKWPFITNQKENLSLCACMRFIKNTDILKRSLNTGILKGRPGCSLLFFYIFLLFFHLFLEFKVFFCCFYIFKCKKKFRINLKCFFP